MKTETISSEPYLIHGLRDWTKCEFHTIELPCLLHQPGWTVTLAGKYITWRATISTKKQVVIRITKGAKFLDKNMPNWFQYKFNWEKFDIRSLYTCILGQNGGYWKNIGEMNISFDDRMNLGFCRVGPENFEWYEIAWKNEVNTRLLW